MKLIKGDCLIEMGKIPSSSIDMILCDLPYGTTKNKWDAIIPFDKMWIEYNRIIKQNGAILLFAQTPFDKLLGCSNIEMLRYELIWEKERGTNFLSANRMPMKNHENILVFSKSYANANSKNPMKYFPIKIKLDKPIKSSYNRDNIVSENYRTSVKQINTVNKTYTDKHPNTVIKFSRDKDKFHPTQKPVKLLEYLIRTYTLEGDTVLDNCMGSGSTGLACINTNRDFIGIELNERYFNVAKQRINSSKSFAL